jgi:hypothetical protein
MADEIGQLFDGLPLAGRATSQVVEALGAYGAPTEEGLQIMSSDWPSQAVHAVMQSTSALYRRMRKAYKQEAVERLKAAGWSLSPEDLADRLGYNLLIVLTCATRRGASKKLSKVPVANAEKAGRPWVVLATDGSGLQWYPVADRHRNYLLSWPVGSTISGAAETRPCRTYKAGALVGYQGTTWRVLGAAGPAGGPGGLLLEDTKNSARQTVLQPEAIEASRAPVAESRESIANRAEEIKRKTSGTIEAYTSVAYALDDLQALIDAEE